MTEIICISAAGKARTCRETVAKLLRGELSKAEKRVLVTHFADPLKQICRNWYGWDGKMDDSGRSLLQYIGTDTVRAKRPDFWVDYTLGLISMFCDDWDYVIIPDCRWPNEMDLGRYGFQPRFIQIDGKNVSSDNLTPAPDFTIVYNDSSDQLRSDVTRIADNLLYV